jgi:hypothetical protein
MRRVAIIAVVLALPFQVFAQTGQTKSAMTLSDKRILSKEYLKSALAAASAWIDGLA